MKRLKKIMGLLLFTLVVTFLCPTVISQIGNPVEVQASTTIKTPKLISAQPSGKTKAVIKWKKVSGVSGYKIYRSINGSSWKTLKTISGSTKVTYTDSKLQPGYKYSYTVRAYKKVNGKNVWSNYNKNGISVIAGLPYLKLNAGSISLYEENTYTLKLNGTNLNPMWKSNNQDVATVSNNGEVIAKKEGTATIIATLWDKEFYCNVTVKGDYIDVSETSIQMEAGESKEININSNFQTLWKFNINNNGVFYCEWINANDNANYTIKIHAKSGGIGTIRIQNSKENPTFYKDIIITVKDDLINNKQKLKSYILNNGHKNNNGDYFIKQERTSGNLQHVWAVVYEINKNTFKFLLTNKESRYEDAMVMSLPLGNVNNVDAEFKYVINDNYSYFGAVTTINLPSFTKESIQPFTITKYSDSFFGIEDKAKSLANTTLQLAFTGWDSLLWDNTGLTMKNIGFTSYK